ncbi:MAG: hypothetical protein IJ080_08075, partial [Oscillospiraceae bacterium]|nr:hypothetical protein [Oscillospiraceae bacterium]
IPSFSGYFDGNGHHISGITISGDEHSAGLFRYIETSGRVCDLTVSAEIRPSGLSEDCGGIAGVNRGTISSCRFDGKVKGKTSIGGIAGINEKTGLIAGCSSSGAVQAEHFSGGIAGKNSGVILRCDNSSRVNTDTLDINLGMTSISADSFSLDSLHTASSAETVAAVSDIGGICGWSDGIISDCVNSGAVGYMHTGYNIGGIVGRHEGYVSSCTNSGVINGRKDIGGIAGQAEPYTALLFSESDTEKLRAQLKELTNLIDDAIAHADTSADDINSQSQRLTSKLDEIRSAADKYTDIADGIINENIETVNEFSARISDLIDRLSPFTEKIGQAADKYASALDSLAQAADVLEKSADDADKALEILRPGLDELSESAGSLTDGVNGLSDALEELKAAIGDPEEFSRRAADFETRLSELKGRFDRISDAAADLIDALDRGEYTTRQNVRDVLDALKEMKESADGISWRTDDIRTKLHNIADSIRNGSDMDYRQALSDLVTEIADRTDIQRFSSAMSAFIDSMGRLIDEDAAMQIYDAAVRVSDEMHTDTGTVPRLEEDRQRIQESADHIYSMIDTLITAGSDTGEAGVSAQEFISTLEEAWDFLEGSETDLIEAVELTGDALSGAEDGTSVIKDAFDIVHDINEYFAGKTALVFTGAGDDIIQARNEISGLAGSFLDIIDEFSAVGNSSADILTDDMLKVNDKLSDISSTLMDMTGSITGRSLDIEDYTRDISAQDTKGRADGKTYRCTNSGHVNGDIAVGGIVGTMAAENALDPEDDLRISGDRSLDFVYTTRTLVSECTDTGDVTAKRNYAGGIAGDMATGCILSCRAKGTIESTEGDHVGGIVGKSDAVVLTCEAACTVSGGDLVGGIAGEGHTLTSCAAFAQIPVHGEKFGSVAGYADDMKGNIFVDNGIGGCDNISYEGKASPVSYEEFREKADGLLSEIVLTFVVCDDDVTTEVKRISVGYGEDISEAQLPQIPEKEGYFAHWEDFPMENITFSRVIRADYTKFITTIASSLTDEQGRPRLMAEGSFDEDAVLGAEQTGTGLKVSLPDDREHLIRYLPERRADRTLISIDGRAVDAQTDGSYLVFTAQAADGTLTIGESEKPVPTVYIIAAASAGVLAVVLIAVLAARRHKKKRI